MNPTITTGVIAIILAVSRADDFCSSKRVKDEIKNGTYTDCSDYILHEASGLTLSQIKRIGNSSNVCKDLTVPCTDLLDARVQALSDKTLIEVLPLSCLKRIADSSSAHFDGLWDAIDEDKRSRRAFFSRHKDSICSSRRRFSGTHMEDRLEKYCKERKWDNTKKEMRGAIEASKAEIEAQKREAEALRRKANGNDAHASSVASQAVLFLPLLAAVLFF